VSAAGKNIPVLVSPDVVIAGKDTVPAGVTNPELFAENSVAPVLLLILKLLSESSIIELIVIEPAILSL
jgi:hypothetical protein